MMSRIRSSRSGHPSLELISPFSSSLDARLRGNAINALAALMSGKDAVLANDSENELIKVLSAGPHEPGIEWESRFFSRVLYAFNRMPDNTRQRILKRLYVEMKSADDAAQQRVSARSLLELGADGRLSRAVGWIGILRILSKAGRPSVPKTLWNVIWQMGIILIAFASLAFTLPEFMRPELEILTSRFFDVYTFNIVILTCLYMISISGEVKLLLKQRALDVIMAGLAFAVSASVLVPYFVLRKPVGALNEFKFHPIDLIDLSVISLVGFLIGVSIRTMRWSVFFGSRFSRMLNLGMGITAAFSTTTIVCAIVASLGFDTRFVGAAWLVLSATAMSAATLDVWLKSREPQMRIRQQIRSRSIIDALTPAATALLFSIASYIIYQGYIRDAEVAHSSGPSEVLTSDKTKDGIILTAPLAQNMLIRIENAGYYTIASKYQDESIDLKMVIRDLAARDGATVADDPDPPATTVWLKQGEYVVCVAKYQIRSDMGCGRETAMHRDISLTGAALVGGARIKVDLRPSTTVQKRDEKQDESVTVAVTRAKPGDQ